MKKKLLALIERHNAVVDALSGCDLPVPEGKVFRAMEVWHKLACEGYDITHMAREAGIDAKCDMQAGRITVYGDIQESGTDAEGVCPVCGGKIEHTGELILTAAAPTGNTPEASALSILAWWVWRMTSRSPRGFSSMPTTA